mgnify:CR=1 FL=1
MKNKTAVEYRSKIRLRCSILAVSIFLLSACQEQADRFPKKLDKRANESWIDEKTSAEILSELKYIKFDYEEFMKNLEKRGVVFNSEQRKPVASYTGLPHWGSERGYYFYFPTGNPARYNTLLIETGGGLIHFGKRPIRRAALVQECQWTLFHTDESCTIEKVAPVPREFDISNDGSDNEPVCARVRDTLIEKYFSNQKDNENAQILLNGIFVDFPINLNSSHKKSGLHNSFQKARPYRIDELYLYRTYSKKSNIFMERLQITSIYTMSVCSRTYIEKDQ